MTRPEAPTLRAAIAGCQPVKSFSTGEGLV